MRISSYEAAGHESLTLPVGKLEDPWRRSDRWGPFLHTGGGFTFCSLVWLLYFLDNKLEVDRIPTFVPGVFYQLGLEDPMDTIAQPSKTMTHGGSTTTSSNRLSSQHSHGWHQKTEAWCGWAAHHMEKLGGVSPLLEDSPLLSEQETKRHIYPTTGMGSACNDWNHWTPTSWLTIPALARLVKKCIMDGSWPRDIALHLQVARNSGWDDAGPLAKYVQ